MSFENRKDNFGKRVLVVRQSGRPVYLEKLEEFEAEFKARYDEAYDRLKDSMDLMSDALAAVDAELADKYDTAVEWDFVESPDLFAKMVVEYGSILVSTHRETGQLMYVIMDQGL